MNGKPGANHLDELCVHSISGFATCMRHAGHAVQEQWAASCSATAAATLAVYTRAAGCGLRRPIRSCVTRGVAGSMLKRGEANLTRNSLSLHPCTDVQTRQCTLTPCVGNRQTGETKDSRHPAAAALHLTPRNGGRRLARRPRPMQRQQHGAPCVPRPGQDEARSSGEFRVSIYLIGLRATQH